MVAGGEAGAEVEIEGQFLIERCGFDIAHPVDDVERFGQQLAAGFVEPQLSADSVEQWRAELLFEFGERHAGGRLRHGNRFRSAGNVPMIGDGSEDFQLAQRDFHL